jgi:DNA-binding NtrC family response regulator
MNIPLLAAGFLRVATPKLHLAPDAVAYVTARDRPGNVRELRALTEAAVVLDDPTQSLLDAELLRFATGEPKARDRPMVPETG